jgi:hypothetical protein
MKRRDRESGQSLVEFALVVPLLFLLLFGSIEFGRVFHAHLVITSAAREGARKAIVTSNENEIRTAIKNAAASLNPNEPTNEPLVNIENKNLYPNSKEIWYNIRYPDGENAGKPVEIYVKSRVDIIVPLVSNVIGTPKPVPSKGAKAVMMVETRV